MTENKSSDEVTKLKNVTASEESLQEASKLVENCTCTYPRNMGACRYCIAEALASKSQEIEGLKKELATCRELSDYRLDGESNQRKMVIGLQKEIEALEEKCKDYAGTLHGKGLKIEALEKEIESLKERLLHAGINEQHFAEKYYKQQEKLREEISSLHQILGECKDALESIHQIASEHEVSESNTVQINEIAIKSISAIQSIESKKEVSKNGKR